jgi:hypothetical protein
LDAPAATRRDVIKKIIEPDDFNFRRFLDAVVLQLAWREAGDVKGAHGPTAKTNALLWHRVLQLYERETNFALNPRLQLEALMV